MVIDFLYKIDDLKGTLRPQELEVMLNLRTKAEWHDILDMAFGPGRVDVQYYFNFPQAINQAVIMALILRANFATEEAQGELFRYFAKERPNLEQDTNSYNEFLGLIDVEALLKFFTDRNPSVHIGEVTNPAETLRQIINTSVTSKIADNIQVLKLGVNQQNRQAWVLLERTFPAISGIQYENRVEEPAFNDPHINAFRYVMLAQEKALELRHGTEESFNIHNDDLDAANIAIELLQKQGIEARIVTGKVRNKTELAIKLIGRMAEESFEAESRELSSKIIESLSKGTSYRFNQGHYSKEVIAEALRIVRLKFNIEVVPPYDGDMEHRITIKLVKEATPAKTPAPNPTATALIVSTATEGTTTNNVVDKLEDYEEKSLGDLLEIIEGVGQNNDEAFERLTRFISTSNGGLWELVRMALTHEIRLGILIEILKRITSETEIFENRPGNDIDSFNYIDYTIYYLENTSVSVGEMLDEWISSAKTTIKKWINKS